MKKIIAAIVSLTLTATLSTAVFAEPAQTTEITESTAQNGETVISTEISATYTVTIPANTEVEFNAASTDFGEIKLTQAQIDPGYEVYVTIDTDNLLENKADTTKTIAYTINDKGDSSVFDGVSLLKAEDSAALSIEISEESWNTAYAGEYDDTVTFNVNYRAIPQT